jgi:anaerobic dimethyl sulfoxide reductase subunit A
VYRWPDAILEGREGGYPTDVRAVYNVGGNYLVQGADSRKSARAFDTLDFAVCHDYFLTPTARYCDVVLPATTHLERADIALPPTNHLFYSHKAVDPLHQSRNDYDIFCELADRFGFGEAFSSGRTADAWIDHLLEESEVDDLEAFKRTGVHDGGSHDRVGLSDFIANPSGNPLPTASGKIELAPTSYGETGFPAWPTSRAMETSEAFPLRLCTPHPRYRIHSQGFGIPWFDEKEPPAIWIHPVDAEDRSISHGETVVVSSSTGRVRIPARVTEDVVRGAACLVQGAWPRFDETGVDTAGSANVLTPTDPTLPSEGSRTHSVAVQVSRET